MSSSLNILCIDSSTEACSVALLTKDATTYQRFMFAPREHTQKILPTVDDVVKEAKLSLADIDVIAYGQGPGSFTGVRIGISIAQGLAYGLEKKMVGISTLQAMAQQALHNDKQCSSVYAAIDARMGEVYFAHYINENGVMVLQDKEVVIKPEALIEQQQNNGILVQQNSQLVGTGWAAYPELLTFFQTCSVSDILYPNAEFMLKSAALLIANDKAVEPELAIPVYLRDTVTWKKLPGRE
ncbi:tRNA (adenosine(37)-N6)-threonylcarbamoyltransferase complex dimerization subunit type 1 TsaB [uncultured Psychromonas sp.]|uniref:tRNA (adenosine(37)-N6)-threonylcarbamoyltransferase complex dimerization subunit type 1 TsaB n=1 Tax=uncultured Psychromonas sp. TaxID=173974 RepID=UPI0026019196|nr:tRNA (adenosine(37)-N6)-threonylcarbamoyltransferase complex dimerization subunit type 1 TsaB [uncultured Psychromonas sp.]